MLSRILLATCCVVPMASLSAGAIEGEYLEARNCDLWTGECNANSEIGIVGNKAILAWKVTRGEHLGVALDGLAVAAVVIGDDTFGIAEEVNTRSVLLVDEKANPQQRAALIDLARDLAGDTIQEVVAVRDTPIELRTAYCDGLGCARLQAGDAAILTRCLCERDKVCGHEVIAYPVLSRTQNAYAAYTLENRYSGSELGETFADPNAKSAVIATFAL